MNIEIREALALLGLLIATVPLAALPAEPDALAAAPQTVHLQEVELDTASRPALPGKLYGCPRYSYCYTQSHLACDQECSGPYGGWPECYASCMWAECRSCLDEEPLEPERPAWAAPALAFDWSFTASAADRSERPAPALPMNGAGCCATAVEPGDCPPCCQDFYNECIGVVAWDGDYSHEDEVFCTWRQAQCLGNCNGCTY